MDELDRFKRAWRDAQGSEGPVAPTGDALPVVRARLARMRRTIVARDRRETWAGVAAAILFVVFAVRATAALPRIAYAVSIAATAIIVWRLRRARSAASARAPAVSVLAFCRAERATVNDQIRLFAACKTSRPAARRGNQVL